MSTMLVEMCVNHSVDYAGGNVCRPWCRLWWSVPAMQVEMCVDYGGVC